MKITDTVAGLLCAGGMVILGGSVSLSQLLLDYPTLTGQAIRYAVAAAALFLLARRWPRLGTSAGPDPEHADALRSPRPTLRELVVLVALAATGMAAFNACVLIALRHADPGVVGTVIGASPLGFALLAPLLRGRRPAPRLLGAAGIVVAGTALVQGTGRADGVGVLAALGALGGEIAFSLLAAAVLPRLGPVRVAAYSCALAVPLLLLAALPVGEVTRWRLPTAVEAATLGYLAIAMTVVAFVAWFTGLRRLGVERAGMYTGVMPMAALATAAVQAGRLPALGQSAGVLIVAVGLAVGLTTRSGRVRTSATRTGQDGGAAAEDSAARTVSA